MKRINPSGRRKSSKPAAAGSHSALATPLGVIVALATAAAFLPVLQNDFVTWDDPEMLLDHSSYRGFGWAELRWMFTTFHMGHYQPLSWLTFALDSVVWGLDPFGFHLSNLVLHSVNAVACYFVARQLLGLAIPEAARQRSWAVGVGAAFAALVFSLHPLRVESVAWATERRDVLSGSFYLWTVYAYLRAQTFAGDIRPSRRWLAGALCLYLLSLLSKATAMTLPIVLVLLDIYPLRRLGWNVRQWSTPQARKVWFEKAPFAVFALLFAAIAILGQQQAAALKSWESYGMGPRLAQAFFGAGFYLWKTLVPTGLSPLYEIPPDYGFWDVLSLGSGVAALFATCVLLLARDRRPALLACWLYYLVLLAPVLGFAQSGPQLVADRYSYLSCLSWAMLAGGILLVLLREKGSRVRGITPVAVAGAGALSIIVVLAVLTWRQSFIWRNTETLWAHVIDKDPNGSYGHYNLAREIARKGMHQEAMRHYREALRIRPADADARNNLGLLLAVSGDLEASLAELRRAVEIHPGYARGYYNLGRVLTRRGDPEGAERHFRKALELEPQEAEIHLALGGLLERQGRFAAAGTHFKEAVRLRPDSADAHVALARWLARQDKKEQAARHYQEALRLLKSRADQRPSPRAPAEGAAFPTLS